MTTTPISAVENRTFTIGVGGDFPDLQSAIAVLSKQMLVPTFYTTLVVLDGTITSNAPVIIETSFGKQIKIQGQNAYARATTSVQSSSGSAGAWSIVLNVDSVVNVSVGDYFAITSASGGTLPTYLLGAHEITAVDAANARVTIASKHKNATPPSGAVVASGKVLKAVLKFNASNGINVWNGAAQINANNIAIVGDGTSGKYGIAVDDCDRFFSESLVAVCNFERGINTIQNSQTNCDGTFIASGCGTGFVCAMGGSLNSILIASGCSVDGALADTGGVMIALAGSVSTGNTANGWHGTNGGLIYAPSTTATGNGARGYFAESQSLVVNTGATSSNVTADLVGMQTLGRLVLAANETVRWASSTGLSSPADGVTVVQTNAGGGKTVAQLTALGNPLNGRAMVTDSTVAASGNFAAVVAGGGANTVPVFNDGVSWKIG